MSTAEMMSFKQSELSADILSSVLSLNATIHGDSSPRSAMFAGHAGQALPVIGSTPDMLKTGQEYEYGKYTYMVKAPCEMLVIAVIKRFNMTVGLGGIASNPETYVIYERLTGKQRSLEQSHVFGVLRIPTYHTRNHALGFKYVFNQSNMSRLQPGEMFLKDAVFAHSPNLTPGGDYKYGRSTNVAYMALPEVEQDGMLVTESFANAMSCDRIESRIVQWSENTILLNLYGDENNYKPFPDVGDVIRPDGILCAIRKIDPLVGAVNLTPKALMKVDPIFDICKYGEAGATVTDINIKSDRMRTGRTVVQYYDKQAEKYEKEARNFSIRMRDTWDKLSRQHGTTMVLEPDLNLLVMDAISNTGGLDRRMDSQTKEIMSMDKGMQIFNKVPVGDWRAEITFVKRIEAGVRFKITCKHGGKGVIVRVIPDADAPTDQFGTRADVVMDNMSITKRMNLGKPAEHYINGASAYATKVVREMVTGGDLDTAYLHLMSYYEAASYEQYMLMQNPAFADKANRDKHVRWVCEHGIELYCKTDRKYYGAEQIRRIMKHHDFPSSPARYKAHNGEYVWTKDNVTIAPMYIMLLEKMGEYWSSCAFPKLTHFGTLSTITQADKYALPWRNTPARFCGESEVRLFLAAMGGWYVNRLLSFSNTPLLQKAAVAKILRTPNVYKIDDLIDTRVCGLSKGRPITLYKHVQGARGIKFVRQGVH